METYYYIKEQCLQLPALIGIKGILSRQRQTVTVRGETCLTFETHVQVVEPPLRRTVQVLAALGPHWSVRSTVTHTDADKDTHGNALIKSTATESRRP